VFTTPNLQDGAYKLRVKANDGFRDSVVIAERNWTVDTTAPDTDIAEGPAAGSSVVGPHVTFRFSSADSGATFECRIDNGAFAACANPYTTPALQAGDHTLQVRAKDNVGNIDASPASRSWRTIVLDKDNDDAVATPPVAIPTVVPAPAPAPPPPVTPTPPAPPVNVTLSYFMRAGKKSTRFSTLTVKGVPKGATVTLTCKGTCPKKRLRITSAKGGTVKLGVFTKRALKVGTTLTVTVTKPGMVGTVKVIKVRARKRPLVTTRQAGAR
jgi:hypothetical protein